MKKWNIGFRQIIIAGLLMTAASMVYAQKGPSTKLRTGRPLKIFILAGQSNMQGQARVRTIERLKLTADSQEMYKDMMVKDGIPSAVKDVYGVRFGGGDMKRGKPRELVVGKGPLKPSLSEITTGDTRFGPEYTFSIYMKKQLNEPFLIIKTAWGGRNLLEQFRPPSAGKHEKDKGYHGNPIGHYYKLMVECVKKVLADPGQYHPDYRKEDGYEIAGFVWFQGYNDFYGNYPTTDDGRDFSEYTRLLGCLIRDLRKDLNVPNMPAVIGAIGTGGPSDDPKNQRVRLAKAQMAVAELKDFKGNVAAVETDQFWDMELRRIETKLTDAVLKKVKDETPTLKGKGLGRAIKRNKKEMAPIILSEQERAFLEVATSDGAYHYMGSAYIYGRIGKGFAEAMARLLKGAGK